MISIKEMQECYGPYSMKTTEQVAFEVFPDGDSLIVGAISLLEMAFHVGPCSGPQADIADAIRACKKAILGHDIRICPVCCKHGCQGEKEQR